MNNFKWQSFALSAMIGRQRGNQWICPHQNEVMKMMRREYYANLPPFFYFLL